MLALDDPLWWRLPTAYLKINTAEALATLVEGWDDAAGQALCWTHLHHDGSVYPASYAAAPWLLHIARNQPRAQPEIAAFLAELTLCARADDEAARPAWQSTGRLAGLGLTRREYDRPHLAREQRPRRRDEPSLREIESDFVDLTPAVAALCAERMGTQPDLDDAYLLLGGYAAARGETSLADAICGVGEGWARLPCRNCPDWILAAPFGRDFGLYPLPRDIRDDAVTDEQRVVATVRHAVKAAKDGSAKAAADLEAGKPAQATSTVAVKTGLALRSDNATLARCAQLGVDCRHDEVLALIDLLAQDIKCPNCGQSTGFV